MHTILIRKESRRGCDIDKHGKLRIITIIKSFPFQIIVIVTVSECSVANYTHIAFVL